MMPDRRLRSLRVLLVGGGAREHVLAWKLSQSPLLAALAAAPGNPGIGRLATLVPIADHDTAALVAHARAERYDLVIIGPEEPLAAGIVDALEAAGIATVGPTAAAARIESSKWFTKELCERAGIPTARSALFTDLAAARSYAAGQPLPLVLKADGLCRGKGVTIATTRAEAEETLRAMLIEGLFGEAGRRVVVEEFLEGQELSVLAFCDGVRALPMLPARDHKRAYDGDRGPNTGGMGAFAPADDGRPDIADRITETILQPAVDTLRADGTPFLGILFAGCMLTQHGPMLVEFNGRFGDPEAEVILPLLEDDLLDLLLRCREGGLSGVQLHWSERACTGVVLASPGYPAAATTGIAIGGLEEAEALPETFVFHAGTALRDGSIVTSGGRVLCVCGIDADPVAAARRAYRAVECIRLPGAQYRHDIATRLPVDRRSTS